jgi:hypothetical protein
VRDLPGVAACRFAKMRQIHCSVVLFEIIVALEIVLFGCENRDS